MKPVIFTLLKSGKKKYFAHIFYSARKRAGLTQIEMAKKLRCSQGRLSKIESGLLEPGAGDICWLAQNCLGVQLISAFETLFEEVA